MVTSYLTKNIFKEQKNILLQVQVWYVYIRLLSGSIESGSGIVWAWIVCWSAADYCDTNNSVTPHRNMYADSTKLRLIQPLPRFSL